MASTRDGSFPGPRPTGGQLVTATLGKGALAGLKSLFPRDCPVLFILFFFFLGKGLFVTQIHEFVGALIQHRTGAGWGDQHKPCSLELAGYRVALPKGAQVTMSALRKWARVRKRVKLYSGCNSQLFRKQNCFQSYYLLSYSNTQDQKKKY